MSRRLYEPVLSFSLKSSSPRIIYTKYYDVKHLLSFNFLYTPRYSLTSTKINCLDINPLDL